MSTQCCSIRNLRCATIALFIAAGLEGFRQIAFVDALQSHVAASLLYASIVYLVIFGLLWNSNLKSALLSPLESAEGILVTAATLDISVRKAAERHLAQTEARYRGLLEAAPDAMIVVNQSGEIILLNAQAERTFGYHRDELLGQKVKDIIPEGFAERLMEDDLRTVADALAQQIGTGIELSARRKDGSEFPIEIMLSPLESAEGILVTAAIRDISVRKAAERHLAQTEARYRGLLEAAPDAMVISDGQGHIVLVNAETERMFGYSRSELVGKLVEILVPERFRGKHPQQRQGYTAHPHSRTMKEGLELYGLRKNGTEFPAEIGLSPLETSEGLLVTAAIRDISVRKRAENALSESEERFRVQAEADLLLNQQIQFKDEFLSHVSHELRSPLTAIYQFATILLDRLAGDLNPEQLEFLEIILRNIKQLQSMISPSR